MPSPPLSSSDTARPAGRAAPAWAFGALAAIVALSAALGASGGCTEAGLEPIPKAPIYRDDKLSVGGALCTRSPDTLTFPLKVLFVIDSSVSMAYTDPPDPVTGEAGRQRALRETYTRLLDGEAGANSGVEIGVIRFSAQASSETAGPDTNMDDVPDSFLTANQMLLESATARLGVTDRTTNYINGLGEAYYELRHEFETTEDTASLPLSKVIVIFLSDGVPDVDSSDARENTTDAILEQVEALQKLAETYRVGDFSFHTAFLSSGQAALDQRAQALLKRMAEVGGGSFRSFPNGEELNFLFVDFSVLNRIFTLKTLAAINLNITKDTQQIPADVLPPTPDMGMGMGGGGDMGAVMERDLGPPPVPVQPEVPRHSYLDVDNDGRISCGDPMVDSDGDGLSDIAEAEAGTDPLVPDTDDDGLSDYLEWRLRVDGLDPLDDRQTPCLKRRDCLDQDNDGLCDCVLDADANGVCDCAELEGAVCDDEANGRDCVDIKPIDPTTGLSMPDGVCDCRDLDRDGLCDYDDRDNDGLRDCEEPLYNTQYNANDTDADGIPDDIEARFGTNPGKADILEDLDADRTLNGIELLANTNPVCDDASTRSRQAYRYQLDERGLEGDKTCYDFRVDNITLVPTLQRPDALLDGSPDPGGWPGDGANRILIYAGEVAFDDPDSFARYRVACVVARYHPDGNYRDPPSGRVTIREEDFIDVSEFDADTHCKPPSR